MEHDGSRCARSLSDGSAALLRQLAGGRADSRAVLDELERRGEPAAIPGLIAFLVRAKGDDAVQCVRALCTLLDRAPNRDLAWLDRLVRNRTWMYDDTWERPRFERARAPPRSVSRPRGQPRPGGARCALRTGARDHRAGQQGRVG